MNATLPRALGRMLRATHPERDLTLLSRSLRHERSLHKSTRPPAITASHLRLRPTPDHNHHRQAPAPSHNPTSTRSIFIQTQTTPNADALKFLPNVDVLPQEFPSPYVEYTSPRATLAPPHPSQLASRLLAVDGVSSVFYGPDFITVTKAGDVNWAHIKPEVFSLITEAVTTGEPMVSVAAKGDSSEGQAVETDSLAVNDDDDEVVAMIKELLETRIRPAIQEDGGDIDFRGFDTTTGLVSLKLRGACRTCDSSTVTLKNGIESMLMHYVSSQCA